MQILNGVASGTYGPFFLDGGTLQFSGSGSATGASGIAVKGVLVDEFGLQLAQVTIAAGGAGGFSGIPKAIVPPGNWTFTVDPVVVSVNLAVRRIPE